MRIGVVHSRVQSKRVEVALVVVETTTRSVLGHAMWRAPAGEELSVQLHELYVRAAELFRAHEAEIVIAWSPDPAPGGAGKRAPLMDAMRAEGAALAAAGGTATVIRVASVSGGTVRSAQPNAGGTEAAVDALTAQATGTPADKPLQRCVAAALAWSIRN